MSKKYVRIFYYGQDFLKYKFNKFSSFKKFNSWIGPNEINKVNPKLLEILKRNEDLKKSNLFGGNRLKFNGGIYHHHNNTFEILLFFDFGMFFGWGESSSSLFGGLKFKQSSIVLRYDYRINPNSQQYLDDKWGTYCSGLEYMDIIEKGHYLYDLEIGREWYSGIRREVTRTFPIKNEEIHLCFQEIKKHRLGLEEQKRQEFHKKEKEKRERLNEEKKLRGQQKHFKNLERKKVLQEGVTKFINEFDSDKDGIIDFNQGGDDFMNLLKKHQKTIIQVDQNHITKLIQVSNYLKTKRGNIQTQFEKIKNSRNSKQLNEFTGILKNQIDTFNLLNYNSLIIIISLVEGDLITFNEIYLTFDKLNIFNSNWENQVSDKLNNIDSKLDEVIYSINKMELSIVNEILGMSIMNQVQMNRLNKNVKEGNMMIDENLSRLNSSLSSNLKSIDSTLKVGNLISTINTYQNYKINKNTKSLRG